MYNTGLAISQIRIAIDFFEDRERDDGLHRLKLAIDLLEKADMNVEERNAGAESLAQRILADDGRGEMSPGPCADLLKEWRRMKESIPIPSCQ
jgi:hypothetical protein